MALVQSVQNIQGSDIASLTVGGANWASNNIQNNLLIVGLAGWDDASWTLDAGDCTDDKSGGSNTYTLDASYHNNYTGSEYSIAGIWSTVNDSSGAKLTITVQTDQSCYFSLWAAEFSGYKTSGVVGNAGTNDGNSTSPAVTVDISTSNSMMVGMFVDTASTDNGISVEGGWTEIEENEDGAPPDYFNRFSSAFKESLSTGNNTHTWSKVESAVWTACAVEYLVTPIEINKSEAVVMATLIALLIPTLHINKAEALSITEYINLNIPSLITGPVCWGHDTGVEEENIRDFLGDWTGDGAISGSGDAEIITLDAGEYMESLTWNMGSGKAVLDDEKYGTSRGGRFLQYKTGATEETCNGAGWTTYTAPFTSLGWVKLRVEAN